MIMDDRNFSIIHQYRTAFVILTGISKYILSRFISNLSLINHYLVVFSWLYNKFRVNRLLFSSNQSMKDKTVLITGGAGGMGYETAKDLLRRGLIYLSFE